MGKTGQTLDIWMNGRLVGYWSRVGQTHSFQYAQSWLQYSQAYPLSLSIPMSFQQEVIAGPQIEAYFNNLLPDNDAIRRRIQHRYGCSSISAFDLLSEVGQDCIGAIQILKPGETIPSIKRIEAKPLSETAVEHLLEATRTNSLSAVSEEEGLRISLAGAQEKTALLRHKGCWCKPLGPTPTTHILKLPIGKIEPFGIDMHLSLENEWLCLKILQAFGIETAHVELARFGEQKALIVERFDRVRSSDHRYWLRIPQEDLCQAHGVSYVQKYQADGGPGIISIMDLPRMSTKSMKDRKTFLKTQLLFWLLAAPDGHAKNFSIFLEPQGRFSLAPIYDVMSLYPAMGRKIGNIHVRKVKIAMALEGASRHYSWDSIMKRHWLETAKRCGAEPMMQACIDEVIAQFPSVLDTLEGMLDPSFPEEVSHPIFEGMMRSIEILQ